MGKKLKIIYIFLFIFFIFLGSLYGYSDTTYYKNFDSYFEQPVVTFMDLFSNNLRVGAMVVFTGGIANFWDNFMIFGLFSSMLMTFTSWVAIPIILIHGIPEMLGLLFLGIFSVEFWYGIFKRKYDKKIFKFALYGILLILLASILEFYVSTPLFIILS